MRLRLSILVLMISLFIASSAAALPYSALYVFGDSLSDQGNFFAVTADSPIGQRPPLEYTDGTNTGRFTNGLNYIDRLAAELGLASMPSRLGGTNFAYGGARAYYHPFLPPGIGSLEDQFATFSTLTGGNADPDALHVVWVGANDVADFLIGQPADEPAGEPVDLNRSLNTLVGVVDELALAGAKSILVPNIPDLGLVPRFMAISGEFSALATEASAAFNAGLESQLITLESTYSDVDFFRFDTFGFLQEVFNDPASSGFTNVTDPCYSEFVMPGGTTCVDPDEYLSWDGFHPTTAAHQILGTRMAATVVPEPSTGLLLAFGIIAIARVKRKND